MQRPDESLANTAPGFLTLHCNCKRFGKERRTREGEETGEVSKDTSSTAMAGLVHPRQAQTIEPLRPSCASPYKGLPMQIIHNLAILLTQGSTESAAIRSTAIIS